MAHGDIRPLAEARLYRSAVSPIDAALEYIREGWRSVLPLYVLAMGPFSAAMLFTIGVAASRNRSALPAGCLLLTLAVLWKWGFVAVLQRGVQEHLKGEPPLELRGRLFKILLLKLVSGCAMLWASVIVIPALFAFFVSGFATPMLLEEDGPVVPPAVKSIKWINKSIRRLLNTLAVFFALFLIATISIFALQMFLTGPVLAGILGIDSVDLELTLAGRAWIMSVFYFLYAGFDLVWEIAAVFVFYDLRAGRLGTDLSAALKALEEGES